ncbi:hypothetical protein BZA77DRAFT_170881 [Pyronema omphalodes]|nr:hypothetical protein BZA77DRAFT_170881 [Pyronema omphalodes]
MCPRTLCTCGGHTYCLETLHSHTTHRHSLHIPHHQHPANPAPLIPHLSSPRTHFPISTSLIPSTNPSYPQETQTELFTRIANQIGHDLAPISLAARQAQIEEARLDKEREEASNRYWQLDWQIRRLAICSGGGDEVTGGRVVTRTRIQDDDERGRRGRYMQLEFGPVRRRNRSLDGSEGSWEEEELVEVEYERDYGGRRSISVERRRRCGYCHDVGHRSRECRVEYGVHGGGETQNHRSRTPRGAFRHVRA